MRIKTLPLQMLTKAAAARKPLPFTPPPEFLARSRPSAEFAMNSGIIAKLIVIALVFLLLSAAPVAVQAADFNNIDTYTKLVTAINTALTNGFADTINITADITLEADLPQITSTITINGGGNTINGDGKYRPFNNAAGGILTLNNLIINNAYTAGRFDHGASIRSVGELTLNRVTVRNGTTDTTAADSISAGGIFIGSGTSSVVKIKDSAIYNNRSRNNGAGIRIDGGTVTIVNTSIFGNSSQGRGGGISLGGGTLHLYHSTITGNTPDSASSGSISSEAGGGIRVYSGTVTMVNNIIYGNARDDCAIRTNSAVTISQIAGNIIESGSTSNCTSGQTTDDPDLAGPSVHGLGNFYIPRAGSPAIDAISSCITSAVNGLSLATDQRGQPRPRVPGNNCDIGAIEYVPPPPPTQIPAPPQPPSPDDGDDGDGGSSGSAGSSSDDEANQAAAAVIRYSPVQSCQTLQPEIVLNNASSGTSCQRVQAEGIGHPNVIAANPSLVVDIWGWVTPKTQVCFRADSGSIKFIDTTMLPRTVADLPVFSEAGGLLCATIDDAGQVALVAGPPAPPVETATLAADKLSDCMVLLQYMLNLRAEPSGETIAVLPSQVKLTALERADGWFKVDYHGEQGWISAAYVEPIGTCE